MKRRVWGEGEGKSLSLTPPFSPVWQEQSLVYFFLWCFSTSSGREEKLKIKIYVHPYLKKKKPRSVFINLKKQNKV